MKKFFALLLCFALILPFAPPAKAETATAETAALESVNTVTEKTEIVSMRDAYSKTYQLPDGTYQYVARTAPIHYLDSTGAYAEINNEITDAVKRSGYAYTNTANAWNAYFAEKLGSDNAVMMEYGAYTISFSLLEQTGTTAVQKAKDLSARGTLSAYHQSLAGDNRAVIYSDVVPNVDVAYTVQTGTLKEDIILKSKNAPSTFKFRLTTNGLTIKESNGTVALVTASGEEVFTFVPLYMEDANGKRSEKVSLNYTGVKNGYEFTISADSKFLDAKDTAYPVIIDPSIMVTGTDVTFDTCVDQEYPTSNYHLAESLWTGGALGTNAMRTYMKFSLPTNISSYQVTSAYLDLRKKEYDAPTVKAYLVVSNWSANDTTWNNQPIYVSSSATDSIFSYTNDWYRINVTSMVKCWLFEAYANYGLVLKEPSETNSSHKTEFYSSNAASPNKPELIINYATLTNAIPSGSLFNIQNTYSEKYISVNRNSVISQQQTISTTSGSELWRFEQIDTGIYTIESLGVRAEGYGMTGNMLTASATNPAATVGSLTLSPYSSTDTKQWWYICATDHGYTISSYYYPIITLSISNSTATPSLSSAPFFNYWSTYNRTFSDYLENGYANGSAPYVVNVIIDSSAITQYLTSDVYTCATAWNDIDSNIIVKLYLPSHIGAYDPCDFTVAVVGSIFDNEDYGRFYWGSGNVNGNWTSGRIEISLNNAKINSSTALLCDQQMNFLHELGHALKLIHPNVSNSDWHPISIMNPGLPSRAGDYYIPCRPSGYDKYNLNRKW